MKSSQQHFQSSPSPCRRTRRYLTRVGFCLVVSLITFAVLTAASVGVDIG